MTGNKKKICDKKKKKNYKSSPLRNAMANQHQSTPNYRDLANYVRCLQKTLKSSAQKRQQATSRKSMERRVSGFEAIYCNCPSSRLMVAVGRHAWLRWHPRAVTLIPLLHIVLVRQCLLRIHWHVGHVVARHVRVLRHARSAGLRWWDVLVGRFFWRFDLVAAVDTVLVAGTGLGRIQTGLDQVLALGLCDQRLELGCGKSVDKTGLGNDKKKNLGASQHREFIGLLHDTGLALGKGDVATRLVANELDLDLATFAIALLIIIVVVVWCRSTLSLDTARLGSGVAIANGLGLVEFVGRGLVVLVGDVCHGVSEGKDELLFLFLFEYSIDNSSCITAKRDHREWEKRVVEILL